jgi:hypothetical protein
MRSGPRKGRSGDRSARRSSLSCSRSRPRSPRTPSPCSRSATTQSRSCGALPPRTGSRTPCCDEGSHVMRGWGLINDRVQEDHAVYGIKPNARHVNLPYPGRLCPRSRRRHQPEALLRELPRARHGRRLDRAGPWDRHRIFCACRRHERAGGDPAGVARRIDIRVLPARRAHCRSLDRPPASTSTVSPPATD